MKSNILLINPKISSASQNRKVNAMVNITFPTSLGMLASYLTSSGIENIEIIDEQIHPLNDKELLDQIISLQSPRIVGISTLTLNSGRAYELADKIKEIEHDVIIILGGIHPTVATEEVLARGSIDIVVRGEGEETFNELVRSIMDDADYKNIRGISYKQNGSSIYNPDRPLIKDLDLISPFPYSRFEKDFDKYPNFSGIFGSRGCPYSCSFCSSRSISGKIYRHHSVERIIHEIKILVRKYKQESVFLMDDNIAVDRKHFKKLCSAIKNENLHRDAFFHGSLRGDNAADDVLDMAYDANFRILYYGLETGSEDLMAQINKGETVAEVADAIRRSAGKGFSVGTTIIFGLPNETRKDRYNTIKLVKSLPLSSVRFNTLTPYPGTPVYNQEYPEGNIYIKGNCENFGVQYLWEGDDIPYVPEGNDRIELIFDTMWANLSYYLSLRGIRNLLTQKYAAGNVIKLKNKWYLSFQELKKILSLFLYITCRFANITIRMFWRMFIKLFIKRL